MIIYFTDDIQRDAALQRALHRTRTLHQATEVGEHNLRAAVLAALAFQGQLVISGKYTRPMMKLALVAQLLGRSVVYAKDYLTTCAAAAQAGPHAPPIASVRATHVAPEPCGLPH